MTKYQHKCPACGKYHPCSLWGERHLIYCPIAQKEYEVLTGRQGRQVSNRQVSNANAQLEAAVRDASEKCLISIYSAEGVGVKVK